MSKDPADIIQAASGSIDEQVLCNTAKGGLLSTGYLNDQPVIEYLRDSESLEYLFDNKSNGVIVQRNGSQKTLDASSGYRSVFAVTSERIFFVVGRDDGDTSASIEYQNVENATFESKFLSGTIEVRTKDGKITYRTNRGDDGEGAAEYIREKASQTSHQESEESPSDQSQANQLLSVDRVQKRETLSEDIARDLAEVREQFDAVGTTIEDIDDATSRLTRAHTTLSKVYDQASSEEVNKGEIDSLLEEIEEILRVLDRVAETRGEVLASLPDEVRDWVESDGELGSAPKASQTEAIEELEEASSLTDGMGFTVEPLVEDIDQLKSVSTSGEEKTYRETLLEDLHSVATELGRVPQYSDFHEHGDHSPQEFTDEFGSWMEALDASSIDIRDRLITDLKRVSDTIGAPPSQSDVDEHGQYPSSWYRSYFDGWKEALDAAGIEYPDREDLLDTVRDVQKQLGRAPTKSDIVECGEYRTVDYRREFESVREAVEKAGISYRDDILESIRSVADEIGQAPRLQDYNERAPYSQGLVYDEFDSWTDALDAAGVSDDDESDDAESREDREHDIEPSPLAEYYEVFQNLLTIHRSLFDSRSVPFDESSPMAEWYKLVEAKVSESSEGEAVGGFGPQQRDRNEFGMRDYRDAFGDGDQVLDFQCIDTRPVPESVTWMLGEINSDSSENLSDIQLPVAPDSNRSVPVIVESGDQLNRAKDVLAEIPSEPSTALDETIADDPEDGTSSSSNSTDSDSEGRRDDTKIESLTELGGVTERIAEALIEHGYETRADIQEADIDDLTEIDDLGDVKAARIRAGVND